MAFAFASLTVRGVGRIEIPGLGVGVMRSIGATAEQSIRERIASGRNFRDAAAKPYSARGPIYVPVFGVDRLASGLRRTKTNLGGVFGLSRREAGLVVRSGAGERKRGAKSVKFEDYAAFKRALGKSGRRDLELSGAMMAAFGVLEADEREVWLGFLNQRDARKAEGNERIERMIGFSPRDVDAIVRAVRTAIGAGIRVR